MEQLISRTGHSGSPPRRIYIDWFSLRRSVSSIEGVRSTIGAFLYNGIYRRRWDEESTPREPEGCEYIWAKQEDSTRGLNDNFIRYD